MKPFKGRLIYLFLTPHWWQGPRILRIVPISQLFLMRSSGKECFPWICWSFFSLELIIRSASIIIGSTLVFTLVFTFPISLPYILSKYSCRWWQLTTMPFSEFYILPQLSVDNAIFGRSCFAMVFLLLGLFPISNIPIVCIFFIYSLSSSSFGAFEFPSRYSPSPTQLLSGNLWMLDLNWKFPCILRSFLVFPLSAFISSFVHFTIPDVYLMTGKMHIFVA